MTFATKTVGATATHVLHVGTAPSAEHESTKFARVAMPSVGLGLHQDSGSYRIDSNTVPRHRRYGSPGVGARGAFETGKEDSDGIPSRPQNPLLADHGTGVLDGKNRGNVETRDTGRI
eukprot:scaffold1222_cov317-Pavlova_lutheri.AAC.27